MLWSQTLRTRSEMAKGVILKDTHPQSKTTTTLRCACLSRDFCVLVAREKEEREEEKERRRKEKGRRREREKEGEDSPHWVHHELFHCCRIWTRLSEIGELLWVFWSMIWPSWDSANSVCFLSFGAATVGGCTISTGNVIYNKIQETNMLPHSLFCSHQVSLLLLLCAAWLTKTQHWYIYHTNEYLLAPCFL